MSNSFIIIYQYYSARLQEVKMSIKAIPFLEEAFPCPNSPVLRPKKLLEEEPESPLFKVYMKANASIGKKDM